MIKQKMECQALNITTQLDTNVLIECDGNLCGRLPAKWSILRREIDLVVPKTWKG